MNDADPNIPQAFDNLCRLQSEIPAKTRELIEFLKTVEDGFSAIAAVTMAMAEQNAAFEQSARLGILGQHAELGDYRREIAALEKHTKHYVGVIVAMVRELTTESPVEGYKIEEKPDAKRIEDARRIGETAIAFYRNETMNRKQP